MFVHQVFLLESSTILFNTCDLLVLELKNNLDL